MQNNKTNTKTLIQKTLELYDIDELQSFVRLKHGFANENYKIVTGKGTYLFRIHLQQSPENIEKEHQLLEILKKEHFPAAFPVKDKTGNTWLQIDGRNVSVYDFVKGTIPEINRETVAETAGVLARLHTLNSAGVPPKTNNTHPEKGIKTMEGFPSAAHPLPDIFDRVLQVWEEVSPFLHETLPAGLIHGDLFPDNTLFEGHRLKAVIDFEEYATDTLLFDVAMCINGFCFVNNKPDHNLLDVFIRAYEQKRPFTQPERKLLPVYIRWASLSMALWHLQFHLMHRPDRRQEKRVRELLHRCDRPGDRF